MTKTRSGLRRLVQRVREGLERGRASALAAPAERRAIRSPDPRRPRPGLEPLEPRILLSADIGLVPDALLASPTESFEPHARPEPELHDELLAREPSRELAPLADPGAASEIDPPAWPGEPGSSTAGDLLLDRIWSSGADGSTRMPGVAQQILVLDARVPEAVSLLRALLDGTTSSDEVDGASARAASDVFAASDEVSDTAGISEISDTSDAADDRSRPLRDAGLLVDALEARGVAVVVLDAERDGLEQIGEIAEAFSGVDAMHVVSHGSSGRLVLGSSEVTADSLRARTDSLAALRQMLGPDGDLLLYGCEVAEGEVGIDFVSTLADLAGVDVAASSDLTGASVLGGDWDLEVAIGSIETPAIEAAAFDGVLRELELVDPTVSAEISLAFDSAIGPNGSWVVTSSAALIDSADPSTPVPPGASLAFEESDSIEIATGEGDDRLTIESVDPSFVGTIRLSGGTGADALVVDRIEAPGFAGTVELEGDAGADELLFAGFAEASPATTLLSGGEGDDRFVFADGTEHVGQLTIEEAVGAGADALVYPAGFEGFESGALAIVDESNVETVDLALGEAALSSLRQGLTDLADWAARLQSEGDLGRALAGVRGNVDVGVGTALDLGQVFDQLRVRVEAELGASTSVTAEDLRTIFQDLSRSGIAHADRTAFGSVVGEGWTAADAFGLAITLDSGAAFRFGIAATTGETSLPLVFEVRLTGLASLTLRREANGDASVRRSVGSWQADGFREGQTLTLAAGRTGENRASADFEIESISGDGRRLTLRLDDANRTAFETIVGDDDIYSTVLDVGADAPIVRVANTVFRSDGARWQDDGFRVGQTVIVEGRDWLGTSGRRIEDISEEGRVLTVDGMVTAQPPGTPATLSAAPIGASGIGLPGLADALNAAIAESDLDGRIEAVATDVVGGLATSTSRLGIRVLDAAVDRATIELFGAATDLERLGFEGERAREGLADELKGLGELAVFVDGPVDLAVDAENGTLRLDLAYRALRESAFDLGLGEAAQEKGVTPGAPVAIDLVSRLASELSLVVGLGDPSPFDLSVGSLRVSAEVLDAEIANGTTIDIGFLGAQVGSDVDDPSVGSGTLSLAAELDLGSSWVSVDLAEDADALRSRAAELARSRESFALDLPLVVKPGLDVVGTGETFRVADLGIFTSETIRVENPFDGSQTLAEDEESPFRRFDEVEAFARIDARGFIRLLGEIRTALARVGESELISDFDVPFVSGGLDRVVDLADAFGDALLFDDGDDGLDRDDDAVLVTDLNEALADAGLGDFVEARVVEIEASEGERTFELFAIDPSVNEIEILVADGDAFFGFASGSATGAEPEFTGFFAFDPARGRLTTPQSAEIVVRRTGSEERGAITLTVDDTADNERVGNDVAKLLDANNAPTFRTAQELKATLAELVVDAIGLEELAFDGAANVLTYEIDLSNDLFETDFPVDFDLDLGPLGNVETVGDPRITIGGEVGFRMKFGIDLSAEPNGRAGIDDDTSLTELRGIDRIGDLIETRPGITARNTPDPETTDESVEIELDRIRLSNGPGLVFEAGQSIDVSADALVNDLVFLAAPDGFNLFVRDARGQSQGDLQQQSLQVPSRPPPATDAEGLLVFDAPALDFELALVNVALGETLSDEGFFSVSLAAQTFTVSSERVFKSRWLEAIERAIVAAQEEGISNAVVRDDGRDWAQDGFAPGQTIEITGSASNDGRHEIEAIEGDRLTLGGDLVRSEEGPSGDPIPEQGIEVEGPGFVRAETPGALAGFEAGDLVQLSGSLRNDGVFLVESRVEQGSTTTLVLSDVLDPEPVSDAIRVTDIGASARLDPTETADARFRIEIDDLRYEVVLAAEADPDDPFAPHTADNESLTDLVQDLRAALSRAVEVGDPDAEEIDLRSRVEVVLEGTRLVLRLATGTLDDDVALSFTSTGTAAGRPTGSVTRTGADEGDAAGSWSDDGFAAGDLIQITDSGANDGLYRIRSLDSETVIAVERLDSTAALVEGGEQTDVRVEGTIAAVSSSVQEPLGVEGDAWTRSAGSFVDEGFEAGQLLVVEGAGARDGTYRISSVEAGRLALADLDGSPVDLGSASDLPGALLSRSFRLTDLNAGARGLGFGSAPGASEQSASLNDLLVTTSDGREFLVSLDGAETVGDVLRRIEAAAVESGAAPDRVRARIAEDGTGIELVERGQLSGSPRLAFEASGSRLVRSEGDWADDGFAIGDEIVVSGTARNDGLHRIVGLEREDPSDPEAGRTVLVLDGALVDEDFVRDAEIVRLGFERGPEDFRVDRINGSNAALGLGILRPDAETDRNEDGEIDVLDADGLIEGSAIGGSSLFDRIFIEDPELRASLFLEPSLPGGIDITGDFGFFEAALNADGRLFAEASIRLDDPGEGDADDGRITLREIATGIQDIRSFVDGPRFAGNALDADAGSILFANDAEGGVITRQAGDWEADDFRVGQRITLRNAGGRDGDYTVRAIEAAAGQTERRILRLEETLPPGTSPDPIPADGALEVVAAIGTLRFEVVQAALGDFVDFAALGPDAAVVLTLYDFGDPFFREVVGPQSKAGGSVSFEASDRIRVTRGSGSEEVDETLADLREALAAREELRLEITYTDAGGEERTASGEIVSIDAEGRIRVEEDLVEAVDGLDVSEVRFTKPPRTDIDTPDLGNLLDFQDIGLRDIIRGLQLASDFLGQFEAFGFLDDPIPVIGTSFNDLLAYADELARVVDDLSRDPDGSLQRLEARLEEILGIDDGTDPALGQDPFDVELTLATEELFGASAGETKSVLRLDLVVGSEWRESLGVDFDLGGEGVLAGSAGLATRAAAEIRVALGLDISQTRMRGDPALVFRARAGEENDEIERLDGESFLGDGFLPGQTIRIEGTSANDGRYEIRGIGAEGRTLILAEDLAASEGEEGVGLSGVELTGSRAVSLFDDTAITASFEAGAENVSFRAAVGPLGLFVNDGRIGIGGGLGADPNAPADEPLDIFRAGLDFAQPTSDGEAPIFASGTAGAADAPYRRQLAETVLNDLGDTFSAELAGGVDVSLPVFFPNDSIERGAVALQVGLALDDENGLTTTGSGVQFFEVGQPDPVAFSELFDLSGLLDLGQLSLFDNVLLAVDGFDLFLGGLQDVLDGEVFGIELPLIGDGLADGARFIEDLREDFVEPFRAAVEDAETFVDDQEDPDRNILSKLLFDLLAPTGLLLVTRDADGNALADADIFTARVENLVTDPGAALAAGQFFLRQVIDLDGTRRDAAGRFFEEDGSVVTEGEIDLAGIPSESLEELAFLEWDFRLGQGLTAVDSDIALDFGLPGLGLEADGAIGLELGWDLELGFGLDFSNGFYFDIGSASELEVEVDVVLPDRLAGRLAFLQLDAINAGSGLGASFAVDVVNRDDPGDDQLSFGELGKLRLETGLAAEARALLDLQLKLNEDLLADFANVFPTVVADFELDWGIGSRGSVALGFEASSAGRGTITRSQGSFVTESYMADQIIRVSGTQDGVNDGGFRILEVNETSLVVELSGSQSFETLVDQQDVTILLDVSSLSGSVLSDGLRLVEFREVGLDLGSFISDFIAPVLSEIQKVTGPIQPIVDLLTSPLPVISDLGPPVTILDLARSTGFLNPALIESVADIITLVNAIPTNVATIVIPFGDFVIFDRSDEALRAIDPTDPDADLSRMNARASGDDRSIDDKLDEQAASDPSKRESTSFVKKLKNTRGFAFPILSDPTQVFGLLTGQEVTLFGFDMPPLEFDFSVTAFFPLFGPLGIGLTGTAGAKVDFAFGFDSSGLQRFFDTDFQNPGLIFDGFFVSDNPEDVTGAGPDGDELTFRLGVGLSAELNLGVARAGVQGGIEAEIFFDLFDPNRDGKIRVGEILENIENEFVFGQPALAPLAIFDLSGRLTARAFAFLKVNLLLFSVDKEFDITPPVTLVDFDVEFTRAPKLATELDDGTLQLNMGEFAEQRLNGDLRDGDEHFRVESASGGLRVTWVGSNGSGPDFTQVYDGRFDRILARGGAGRDVIDVSRVRQSDIVFELHGEAGDDLLDAGSGAAGVRAELHGGAGSDRLIGSAGHDLIFGGAGRDRILGGAGNDLIFADEGRRIESEARIRRASLRLEAGDSTNAPTIERLDGGSFLDDGFAVGQLLEIVDRDSGAEGIYRIAARGIGQLTLDRTGVFAPVAGGPVPTTGRVETSSLEIVAPGSDFTSAYQVIAGTDDGDDAVAGGAGDDWIVGGGGSDVALGGLVGAPGLSSRDQLELLLGLQTGSGTEGIDAASDPAGADVLIGDGGRILLRRDGSLRGIEDTDRGLEFGEDRLFGQGGDDRLFGGRGDDFLRGGAGDDSIHGETGFDHLFGDDDDDRLFGGRDADVIDGGGGEDWIEGEQGEDLIRGGAGDDRIFGQADADTIFGESGSDTIEGGSGLDVIFGGAGDDVLDGGAGDDVVLGDTGGPDFADVESILSAGLIERLRGAVESFESELDGEGPTLAGEDRIAARGGSDLVDGQAGSDRYEIGVRGADTSARVHVFDSGASPLDTDRLTIDGTSGDDQFLLRAAADPTGLAFVASINRGEDVERIDYDGVEALVVNGLFGDDRFALDDVRGSTTLNGGGGDDFFQVGQLYRSRRTNADANVAIEDQFATTETTRGFLSNGISAPTVINGGTDNDEIVVFRNLAALQVNGQDGDDAVTVRAFALVNPEDRLQEETRISGGGGADTIRYAVNAPVSIDGGDGLDSVTVIGTEFADEFVVTKDGVFGAGLNVEFVNVELLRVDGAEGDDSFYIQSTHESILTQVVGGLGSDTFQVADGVERAVTSNDLLGHSGLVLHDVESNDPVFQGPEGLGIAVGGISANVADADEPGIVISETDGFTRLAEGGLVDRYTIVLTRRPEQEVFVKALAPGRSREEIARGEENFRVFSGGNDESDGSGTTLVFDENDWWIPQTVFVEAFDDAALEGERFGVIQHLATSADTRTGLIGSVAAPFFDEDGDVVTDVVLETGLPSEQVLVGRLFEVVSAPDGRTSGGLGQSLLVKSSETIGGVTRLRLFGAFDPEDLPLAGSGYRIAFYDGLQLPNVTVQVDDDDEADVLLTEVQDLRVFEGGLGDTSSLDAFAAYQVELSRAPRDGETVFVDLDVTSPNGEADPLRLSLDRPGSSGGAAGSGVLRLVFRADPADPLAWNRPQTVYVEAIDDAAREGFHRGLIEHRVSTASGADVDEIVQIEGEIIDLTDALGEPGTTSFVLLEALPVQFRGDVREATSDTIAGFAGDAFSVGDLDRALEGRDRSGLVVRVTKGAGAGQVRDVVSIDEGVVRVDRPWDTLPDETSRFSISQLVVEVDGERLAPERFELNGSTVVFFDAESRVEERTASIVRVSYGVLDPGFEGRVEERLSVRVVDDDTAAVLILESDLSTDVIESNPDESGREAIPDTYQVVLSRPPGRPDPLSNEPEGDFEAEGPAFVEVLIEAAPTPTSRGDLLRSGEPQVEVRASQTQAPGSRIDDQGRLVLVFTAETWNVPQTVEVVAKTDGVVDGGDTKVFAPRPRTLVDIQGPLLVDGAGGQGSLEGLTPPVLLPDPDPARRETNLKVPTGDVLEAAPTSLTVDSASLDAYLAERGETDPESLLGRTVEIVRGPGIDQFREIVGLERLGDQTRIDVAPDWDLEADALSGITAYKITRQSLNFFVDERLQQDLVFIHDADSPADSRGRMTELDFEQFPAMVEIFNDSLEPGDPGFLTPDRLVGFGMGPDTEIARGLRPGGITYSNFEGLEIDLGFGNNTLDVDSVHERDDASRTFTRIRTGRGDDVVTVALDEPADPSIGLPWVEIDTGLGDDVVDASASTLGLGIVGGFGRDRLIGGQGDDLIHGDFGSLDFRVVDRTPVAQSVVESLRPGEGGDDTIDGQAGDDRLFGGAGNDTVEGGRDQDVLFGDYGRSTVAGVGRTVVETTELFRGGLDVVDGGEGNDFLFGGAGGDVLRGTFERDLLIGEYARLIVQDGTARSIVRLAQGDQDLAASTFFGVYDPTFGPLAPFSTPAPTRIELSLPPPSLPDIEAVSSTPARRLNAGSGSRPVEEHEVVEGESLWALAERELGDPYRWREIHALNRDEVPDPDLIRVGQQIELPRDSARARRLESDREALTDLRDMLESLDARSEAELAAQWRFTDPLAVGAGPDASPDPEGSPGNGAPGDEGSDTERRDGERTDAADPEGGETSAGDRDETRAGEDGAAREPARPEGIALSGLVWSSLVGWRARPDPATFRRRDRWLRFDEDRGRFA